MQPRAWACAAAVLICAAAWADNDDKDRDNVLSQRDADEIRHDVFERSRVTRESVREALEQAREAIRENAEHHRDHDRIAIESDDDVRHEIRDALREVFRESGRVARDAGEAVHEFLAQNMPVIAGPFAGSFSIFDDAGNARAVDEKKSAAGVNEIEIHNVAGQIAIIGQDADEIHVKGTIGEDVEELVFSVEGGSAEVRVKVPERGIHKKIKSELTITVPKRLKVQANTVSGGVDAHDLQGPLVHLKSVSGGIKIRACSGEIEAGTVSGGIEIADATKTVDAECVSGGVTIKGAPTTVTASSISGGVSIDGVQQEVRANSVSGRVDVKAGGKLSRFSGESVSGGIEYTGALAPSAKVKLNTLSGGVRLTFTEDVSAEFDLRSFSGGIDVDLPNAPKTGKKRLTFTTGSGDSRVDVEAFSGGIRVGKK